MKPLHYILALAAAAALWACDEVDQADRYVEAAEIDVNRAVLVLDFTGQRCTNCPTAHAVIEQLQEQYGDLFIPVSIHAGAQSLSIDNRRYLGLATPLGESYDALFGVAPHGYPSIIIDYNAETVYSGTGSEWVAAARGALQRESIMAMDLEARYEATPEGQSVINITTSFSPGADFSGMLQLWILEDDIVAPQQGVDGQPGFVDYVHNNVLRAAVNGDAGQPIELRDNILASVSNSYTIEGEWEQTWNVDHLKIVAFCYTPSDGVVQAAVAPVRNN